MRNELKQYISQLGLKNYRVSEELPFNNSGTAMYLKNQKTIYVDDDQVTTEPFTQMLNGDFIDAEVTTVRVYLSTDAKQKPSDYTTVISGVKAWKYATANQQYFRKEIDVLTEFDNDLQVTQFEFRFTKLLS